MSGHGTWSGQRTRERREERPDWAYTQEHYDGNATNNGFSGMVDGTDKSSSWTAPETNDSWGRNRGANIESIMDEQGFRGKPKVVGAREFEEAAQKAFNGQGLVLQRGYGSDSSEVLKAYKDSLYDGEWYVSCGGGAAFGFGMYAGFEIGATKPTANTTNIARDYAEMHGTHTRVETMTLAPNAKVATFRQLDKMMSNDPAGKSRANGDRGVYAAMKGYDFMYDTDYGSGYSVVLNRTKLIILNT